MQPTTPDNDADGVGQRPITDAQPLTFLGNSPARHICRTKRAGGRPAATSGGQVPVAATTAPWDGVSGMSLIWPAAGGVRQWSNCFWAGTGQALRERHAGAHGSQDNSAQVVKLSVPPDTTGSSQIPCFMASGCMGNGIRVEKPPITWQGGFAYTHHRIWRLLLIEG